MAIEFMIGLAVVVAGMALELWFIVSGYRELDQILREDQQLGTEYEVWGDGPQTL
jgi:hypothetical protein